MPKYKTDKIGFASFLCIRSVPMIAVHVKNRNRSTFEFDITAEQAGQLELEFTRSDFSRFFEAFKLLREQTIRGATN